MPDPTPIHPRADLHTHFLPDALLWRAPEYRGKKSFTWHSRVLTASWLMTYNGVPSLNLLHWVAWSYRTLWLRLGIIPVNQPRPPSNMEQENFSPTLSWSDQAPALSLALSSSASRTFSHKSTTGAAHRHLPAALPSRSHFQLPRPIQNVFRTDLSDDWLSNRHSGSQTAAARHLPDHQPVQSVRGFTDRDDDTLITDMPLDLAPSTTSRSLRPA